MALAPNRLDWRWDQVIDACGYTEAQALHRLRDADEVVVELYRFKRALDAGRDVSEWPEIAAAHEMFINRENERLFAECGLIADASDEVIAAGLACAPSDIQAFHNVFFDVRPRLKSAGWIASQLFSGSVYSGLSSRDRVGQLRRIAWLGGFEVFEAYYTGCYNPSLANKIATNIRDMLAKQSLLIAGCINGGAEINMQMLSVFLDDTHKQIAETTAGDDDEMGAEIMKFLSSMPLTVADPTAQANLNLPAREPRAHELRTAEVLHVAHSNV